MIPYERRQQLAKKIKENHFVTIEQLLQEMDGVSESTIRRDLKALEEDGVINLMRGGATKAEDAYKGNITARLGQNQEAKEQIARCAARFVKPGDVVYLDAGSTVAAVIPYISGMDITIVTTNILIFERMNPGITRYMTVGGYVNPADGSIGGALTVANLDALYFDKAFIGTTGISERSGITAPNIQESMKKQVVMANAKESYILADSSKVGITTMCKVCELEAATVIMEKHVPLLDECADYIIGE